MIINSFHSSGEVLSFTVCTNLMEQFVNSIVTIQSTKRCLVFDTNFLCWNFRLPIRPLGSSVSNPAQYSTLIKQYWYLYISHVADHKRLLPKSFPDPDMVVSFSKDYMFLACIQHILKVNTVYQSCVIAPQKWLPHSALTMKNVFAICQLKPRLTESSENKI